MRFVVKYKSEVSFAKIPSSSRDDELMANVILSGAPSPASECCAISGISLSGQGSLIKFKISFSECCLQGTVVTVVQSEVLSVSRAVPFQGI